MFLRRRVFFVWFSLYNYFILVNLFFNRVGVVIRYWFFLFFVGIYGFCRRLRKRRWRRLFGELVMSSGFWLYERNETLFGKVVIGVMEGMRYLDVIYFGVSFFGFL